MHIWTTLKIFVSSTFKDLELERDKLAQVFTQIQEQVFERRLHIISYDLRWREKQEVNLVRWCINMVQECGYFVGILGYRYGWRPSTMYDGSKNNSHFSITEMEIRKALEVVPKENRFFCFGNKTQYSHDELSHESEEDRASLEKLKAELKNCGENIYEYENASELLGKIDSMLLQRIDDVYPPGNQVALESYSRQDALLEIIEEKRRGFVGQREHLDSLMSFCESEDKKNVYAIEAVAGTGKSALLAQFIYNWQKKSKIPIIAHYMSMAGDSRSVRGIIQSLAEQLRDSGFIESIETSTSKIIEQVHQTLQTSSEKIILAIDGVDEMDKEGDNLLWLPQWLPENVRFILTTRPTEIWPKLQKYLNPKILVLPPLSEKEIKEIIKHYKNTANIQISKEEETFLVSRSCGSPLFLKVALDEMSAGGIAVGQLAETVETLFHQILKRLQNSYGKKIIIHYLGLIAASRNGLTEVELRETLYEDFNDIADDFLLRLQNSLANFVIQREKLLAFFHPEFERSIKMWLGKGNMRTSHLRLSIYFEKKGFLYERSLSEIAYQIQWAEDYKRLLKLFANVRFLERKCSNGMLADLRSDIEFALTSITVPLSPDLKINITPNVVFEKRSLSLIANIIDIDFHFLLRHPKCLLQSLWNYGYWYDAPESQEYYIEEKESKGICFYKVVQHFLAETEEKNSWVKTLSPLPEPLDSATIKLLRGHEEIVTSICMNQEQEKIASGSWDQSIRIWHKDSGQCLTIMKGHKYYISGVCFIENDKLVSSSGDGTLRIWDVKNGHCLSVLEGHEKDVACVHARFGGKYIASGSKDKTLRVWDNSGKCLHVLHGHTKTINSVFVSSDEEKILSAAWDNTIRIWSRKTGKCLHILEGHENDVKSVCMSEDNNWIFSASRDYTVRVWNAKTGECVNVLPHKSTVFCVCSNEDGSRVATSVYGTVRLWDVKTATCILKLEGHESAIFGLYMAPKNDLLLSASSDKTIRIWDTSKTEKTLFPISHKDAIQNISLNQEETKSITASKDTQICIWDNKNGKKLRTIDAGEHVRFVHFSPQENIIYYGGEKKEIVIFDLEKNEKLFVLQGHKKIIMCAKMSNCGKFLVSAGRGKKVRLWDMEQKKCIQEWTGHSHDIRCINISNDNCYIISGSEDRTVCVWERDKEEASYVFKGHEDGILSVTFFEDKIISSSRDNTTRIWNFNGESEIREGNCEVQQLTQDNPYYVVHQELESVIVDAKNQESIAFFPSLIRKSILTKNNHISGCAGSFMYFLELKL